MSIEDRIEDYEKIPHGVGVLIASVDTQDDRLELLILRKHREWLQKFNNKYLVNYE